jgi:hypothetical protein
MTRSDTDRELLACPECDSPDLVIRTNKGVGPTPSGPEPYKCDNCGADVADPVTRAAYCGDYGFPDESDAALLDAADPDAAP